MRFRICAAGLVLSFSLTPAVLCAQVVAGKHPAYLHAMSDLRDARAYLSNDKSDKIDVRQHDEKAIRQIDQALTDIKKASIDDGKGANDHLPIDTSLDFHGRYARANDLLAKAHQDVSGAEDLPEARGLRAAALQDIAAAEATVQTAMRELKSGK